MTVLAPPEMFAPTEGEAVGHPHLSGPALEESLGAAEPLFKETWRAALRRFTLGTAYALRPLRLRLLPVALGLTAEFLLSEARATRKFDEPQYRGQQGLVGVSEDLSPETLLNRYRSGIIPFSHIGPTKWWSPAVRAVLHPNESRIEKNLRRLIRQGKLKVTFDQDFAGVMQACAEPRPGKTPLTWIRPKIMNAFWKLHLAGHAHSVEVWDSDGQLVGGLYGLAAGQVFFGESQFSTVRDASKIAVATLHCHLAHWGFALRDAKWPTEHLASLGFQTIPRARFEELLKEHAWKPGRVGKWSVDETLDVSSWQPKVSDGRNDHA